MDLSDLDYKWIVRRCVESYLLSLEDEEEESKDDKAVENLRPKRAEDQVICKGHFELITLSGLYTFTETGCKLGSIRVLLANLDASIFGGVVVGSLIAATPVQVTPQVVIQALFVACKSGIFRLANKEVNNVIAEGYPVSQMLSQ